MALWDLYQQTQIRTMKAGQHMAERQALLRDQRTERDIEELEERVAELATLVEAVWTLGRERTGASDDELQAQVHAIVERRELERAAPPARCLSCEAALSPDLDRCQFCGAAAR